MDIEQNIPVARIMTLTAGSSGEEDAPAEELQDSSAASSETTEAPAKKKRRFSMTIEFWVAIILALTALGTAWASWMSELHESIQAASYTNATTQFSEGTSLNNAATLSLSNDMAAWNTLVLLETERRFYLEDGDTKSATRTNQQIEYLIETMIKDSTMAETVRTALHSDPIPNVFSQEQMNAYYQQSTEALAEGKEAFDIGNAANLYADAYGLVRILYSIVMFLLAAIGIYKEPLPRKIMLGMGACIFVIATIYMASLPLPSTFNLGYFLNAATPTS